jgi:uncharacterized membrane protein YtjA (UPF0391 family)
MLRWAIVISVIPLVAAAGSAAAIAKLQFFIFLGLSVVLLIAAAVVGRAAHLGPPRKGASPADTHTLKQ